jgi:hypothetical protein
MALRNSSVLAAPPSTVLLTAIPNLEITAAPDVPGRSIDAPQDTPAEKSSVRG